MTTRGLPRLLFFLYCVEVGVFLVLAPWSASWDRFLLAPPLALLTGSFSADQYQEALATGALGIYAKPLTLETARSLASLVKKMLSEKPKKHFSQPGDAS